MYTRCPQCKTVHRMTAVLLSHTRGLVQCGECKRTFSALSFLFDEWPAGEGHGPSKGANAVPPVLGKPAKKPVSTDNSDQQPEKVDEDKRQQQIWIGAVTLLLILTIANATWTFRKPLQKIPQVNAMMGQSDDHQSGQMGLLKDRSQIQLVSRDMHTHPTRTGILVLSLTFVNLAQHSQAYPKMEITLLDATNQQIAKRRFQPPEYLRAGTDTSRGLATDVYLPVLLELGDPGDQAVGFEIAFY